MFMCCQVGFSDGPQVSVGVRKGGRAMTEVVRRENESLEDALRRFKREVSKGGVLREARRRQHYEKPSEEKKRKREAARRKKRR